MTQNSNKTDEELKKEYTKAIESFLKRNSVGISRSYEKLSQLFEMSCFNFVIQTYTRMGYACSAKNLIDGMFRYKVSPTGHPENFSHFIISRKYKGNDSTFEIHHNLTVRTKVGTDLYITPDVAIIKHGSVKSVKNGNLKYNGKRLYAIVENDDLITYFEAKSNNPFSELLFSFIGMNYAINKTVENPPIAKSKTGLRHLAPSLLMRGSHSRQTILIADYLNSSHCLNVFTDLTSSTGPLFTKKKITTIKFINLIREVL